MKIIVGLGNPGNEYAKTRHNIGFMILDAFAKEHHLTFQSSKFKSEIIKTTLHNESILLVKPQTYMNLSGDALLPILNFYNANIEDVFIIYDDLDLDVGKIRIRNSGSSGGQNGMKHIMKLLKTEKINRMRVGISKDRNIETANYVLGKFTPQQVTIIEETIHLSVKVIDDFIKNDINFIMNRYNKK